MLFWGVLFWVLQLCCSLLFLLLVAIISSPLEIKKLILECSWCQCFCGMHFLDHCSLIPRKQLVNLEFFFPYTGNCWIVRVRTQHWAGYCLLWKVSWLLPKWRSNNYCQSVQAESRTICCSTRTVSLATICKYFTLPRDCLAQFVSISYCWLVCIKFCYSKLFVMTNKCNHRWIISTWSQEFPQPDTSWNSTPVIMYQDLQLRFICYMYLMTWSCCINSCFLASARSRKIIIIYKVQISPYDSIYAYLEGLGWGHEHSECSEELNSRNLGCQSNTVENGVFILIRLAINCLFRMFDFLVMVVSFCTIVWIKILVWKRLLVIVAYVLVHLHEYPLTPNFVVGKCKVTITTEIPILEPF